jgi:cytidine deaminase
MISDKELIRRATEVVDPRRLSPTVEVGGVGSALVTANGNVYVGVCIDTGSSLGFCAEHNATGNMIPHGESRIVSIVAVNWDETILAPCGRCREFIFQIDPANAETRVLLKNDRVVMLKELLPER